MKNSNTISGYKPRKRWWLLSLSAIAMSSVIIVGCSSSSDDPAVAVTPTVPGEPAPLAVVGSSLVCDAVNVTAGSTIASGLIVADPAPDSTPAINISREEAKTGLAASEERPNAGNNLKRLAVIVPGQDPQGIQVPIDDGTGTLVTGGEVRPLIVSYAEQVVGDYELGDGSADIGDPTQLDDMFTSLSLDNGATWKKVAVGETAGKSSIAVQWDGVSTTYGGHSHKPTMKAEGNKILVAWNDKYCPSGNPFDLDLVADPEADYYKVNGSQGKIDYEGVVAPNGKLLYEVPFSCVWTARGILREDPLAAGVYDIEWRQAQQMTSGTRDSNKIWIAAQDIGFAMAWQEDNVGLRSGKGLGPGEGYSGATTNHGTDIWYTHITMEDFDEVCSDPADVDCTATTDDIATIAAMTEKPKAAINYAYPVRISNNESCNPDDTKLYCADHCATTVSVESNNQSGTAITRCVQDDLDYMTADATIAPVAAVLAHAPVTWPAEKQKAVISN